MQFLIIFGLIIEKLTFTVQSVLHLLYSKWLSLATRPGHGHGRHSSRTCPSLGDDSSQEVNGCPSPSLGIHSVSCVRRSHNALNSGKSAIAEVLYV